MMDNASAYGGDPSMAYAIGGSAGDNLAIAVTLKVVTTPGLTPPKALLSSCTSSIEPSVIPEKYKEDWHPDEFLDSAFLDRKCMETCIGKHSFISYSVLKVSAS
jgi:versiconal hemiacetal acetate esterase